MRETQVWSLGWEDLLEKEMATHSSTLAWRIPWREEPGRLQSMGLQRVGHDWATSQWVWSVSHCSLIYISFMISDAQHLFMCFFYHLYIFFREMSIQFLNPFLNWVTSFFVVVDCRSSLYVHVLISYQTHDLKMFSLIMCPAFVLW